MNVFLILSGYTFVFVLFGFMLLLAGLPSAEWKAAGLFRFVGVLSVSFGVVGMVWHRWFGGSLGFVRWITIALALLVALHVAIFPLAVLQSYELRQEELEPFPWQREIPTTLTIAKGALHFLWLLILKPMPYSLIVGWAITSVLHVLPTKGRRRAMRRRGERSSAASPPRSVIAACVYGWMVERKEEEDGSRDDEATRDGGVRRDGIEG